MNLEMDYLSQRGFLYLWVCKQTNMNKKLNWMYWDQRKLLELINIYKLIPIYKLSWVVSFVISLLA